MDMRVLGYRKLDFKADDGSLVQGTQVFTAHLEDGVTGETISKLFVREGMALPPLSPGMTLNVTFTNRGKVEKIEAADTAPKLNISKQ